MRDEKRSGTDPPLEDVALEDHNAAFPVVGVGASAGGLDALKLMLGALPTDTGMGFVIVQHLAPAHSSSLAQILSRATKMPVCEVSDEPAVEPNHVYVIPPGRDMIITGGKLRLLPQERSARHRGIDQFFRSLAEDSGHQAIGVVLSGSASDGTLGLEVIKAEGGITFAQDESAQHDSMPKSAVASGCVDFVLPPEGIAREIARIARHPYVAAVTEQEDGVEQPVHGRIAEIVRRATGVDFTHYKANTVGRRIQRRMMVHKIESVAEYEEHLRASPGEVEALYQDVLINVTSFFRNPEAFETLAQNIFPKLLADRSRQEPVRIWTLGCSTGEEAYSLAIIFAECAEAVKSTVQLQMLASDLNALSVEKARAGRYPRSIAQDVSPDRLRRFFVEEDGHYRISKSIREQIVFSRHNVLCDPPFSRLDFISCRNLLIYLDPVLQQQVLPTLHYALKPGGHLWLGNSESLGASRSLFDVEDARLKIFTRKPGSAPPRRVFQHAPSNTIFPAPAAGPREIHAPMLHRDAERVLLAKFAPPGVVVTSGLEIVQFRGDTGAYLAPAAGLASHELMKMLREGLLVPVRRAIARAGSEGREVREEGVRVRSHEGWRELAIEVIPLNAGPGHEAGFVILFDEGTTPSRAEEDRNPSYELRNDAGEVARLTQELAATREYLQSVIEQQDAANEELQSANEEAQSANEEMQSINEELETSKEEIQSTNEELATLNDELNNRNNELNQLNNDLTNVLTSTQLSILIVSRDLRIRRFTPVAEKSLNLAGGDVGRPLGDIRLSLLIPGLEPLLREVIDTVRSRERDVQDTQGRWFSLRARPYLSHDNKIDGAVVTLMDVDALRRARDYAESIVANVRGPLVVLDAALRVKTGSPAFYEHFQVAPAQTEGRYLYDLGNRQWDIPALRTLLQEVLPKQQDVSDYEVQHTFERLGPRIMLLNAHRLDPAPAEEPLIILSIEDITERRRGEALTAAQKEAFERAAAGEPLLKVLEELVRAAEIQSPARACMAIHLLDEAGAYFVQTAAPTLAESYAQSVDGMAVTSGIGACCAAAARRERVVVPDIAASTDFPKFAELALPLGFRAAWSTPIFSSTSKVLATFVCYYAETREPGPQDDLLGEIVTRTASLLIERERAAETVRATEARYRDLFDLSPMAVYSCDASGVIEKFNRHAAQLWGRKPALGETDERFCGSFKMFRPDGSFMPHEQCPMAEVLSGKIADVRDGQVLIHRPDGSRIAVIVNIRPLKNERGEVTGAINCFYDITERNKGEEARARLAAIVECSDDAIIGNTLDGIITSWNAGAERLFGYTAQEIVGQPVTVLIPPERLSEEADIIGHIRRGEPVEHFETVRRRKDGTLFDVSLTASPIVDSAGRIVGASKIARDITATKRAEETLRASEERYRSIIDSSPDCIKVLDLEGNLLSMEAGQEMLGITDISLLLGKSWIEFWESKEDRAAAAAAVAAAAGGGEGKFIGFFRTLHGLDKWWDVAVTPVRDARGRPARLLAVSRDVTERHEMEGMLVARAAELAQADRSKDEFLAMLAHELRNPLASVRNAAEILRASDAADGERAHAQRIMGRQVENMTRMIDDLLDVSRITEGKIELRRKPVSLEAILTATTSLARSDCAARHQELALSMPAEPVFLDADPTRLEQVFGNLLTNACKYGGDGCHITLRAERDGGQVVVSVSDDGVGIAPELLPRVFDLFVQASRTLDRVHGGLGIGLTLVQRLVKLHGGSIEARSEGLGHGAEFIVRLPILTESPPAPPPLPSVERETPRRILIVDDNRDSARSLATLQTRRGHVTNTAFTGPDAVSAASEFLPEVVLLDIGLPGMDGFEVARKLRAIPALKRAFLIAMSGYGSPEDRSEACAAGFDEYIVKPVDPNRLRNLLRERDDPAKR
jgi:two-component system CheB/CheR fusion protein